jgi:hypothetical protein
VTGDNAGLLPTRKDTPAGVMVSPKIEPKNVAMPCPFAARPVAPRAL